MKYTILEIYEEDHGCEGLMPGEELMDMVFQDYLLMENIQYAKLIHQAMK